MAAKVTDVPADLRIYAKDIPAELLGRLCGEELRARVEYAAQLDQDGKKAAIAELSRYFFQAAWQVLLSEPVAEYVQRDHELAVMIEQASPQLVGYDSKTGQSYSERTLYRAMKARHRRDNRYPPGLAEAVDGQLIAKPSGDPELRELAETILRADA